MHSTPFTLLLLPSLGQGSLCRSTLGCHPGVSPRCRTGLWAAFELVSLWFAKGLSPTNQQFFASKQLKRYLFKRYFFKSPPSPPRLSLTHPPTPAPLLLPAQSSGGLCVAGFSACRPGDVSSPVAWPPPSPAEQTWEKENRQECRSHQRAFQKGSTHPAMPRAAFYQPGLLYSCTDLEIF